MITRMWIATDVYDGATWVYHSGPPRLKKDGSEWEDIDGADAQRAERFAFITEAVIPPPGVCWEVEISIVRVPKDR